MCPPMWAHWRHMVNTIEHVLPSAHPSPQSNSKLIGSAISAQLMAENPYTLQWAIPSPKLPLLMGGSGPHLTHNSLGHSEPRIQMASRSVQPFLHKWPQSVPILYNGTPLCPLKIAHSHGGFEPPPHLTYGWFPVSTSVLNQNGISIGSAVFAGLTSVTDRQTDRPRYSDGNNRPHLRT